MSWLYSLLSTSLQVSAVSRSEIPSNYGLLYKMFSKFLPSGPAVALFIFFTFALNVSDAGSDLGLGVFLHSRLPQSGVHRPFLQGFLSRIRGSVPCGLCDGHSQYHPPQ